MNPDDLNHWNAANAAARLAYFREQHGADYTTLTRPCKVCTRRQPFATCKACVQAAYRARRAA